MKILLVNKFLHPNGGSETYVFGLGRAFEAAGHEVQYFGMEHTGRIVGNRANVYMTEIDFHGSLRSALSAPFRILYSREARKKIRIVLEDMHPDVVHLNNINFQITPSVIDEIKAFDENIRIVYTAHDYQWICPNHMLRIPETGELCTRCIDGHPVQCVRNECIHGSGARSRLGMWEYQLYRRRETYKLVDTVICPSTFMKEMLSRHPHLDGRLMTLHNFLPEKEGFAGGGGAAQEIPSSVADGGTSEGDAAKREAGYILYAGRFDEEKGIRTLAEIAGALPTIPFVCAGRGPLQSLLVPVPNITDVGFTDAAGMEKLYAGAKLMLFPSVWYENCPYSVMEAQMRGIPVAASKIGGVPELMEDGKTGVLCEAGNAESFVKAIGALWNDERRLDEMRARAAAFAKETYPDAASYVEALIPVYRGERTEIG